MADQTVLGSDAVVGWPGILESLTTGMTSVADNVDTIATHLRGDTFDGEWSGDAADGFRDLLKHVPDELSKVTDSYRAGAGTLRTFTGNLQDAVATADLIATQLADAQRRAASVRTRAQTANDGLQAAQDQMQTALSSSDPVGLSSAQRRLEDAEYEANAAVRELSVIDDEIGSLQRQARANRQRFEQYVRDCCDGLDRASSLGIQNSVITFGERIGRDLGAVLGPIGKALAGLVTKSWDIVGAVRDFLEHPSLDGLKRVLDDVGAILTLVGMLALVVAAAAFPPALPAVFAITTAASLTIDSAELEVDTLRYATGTGTLDDIGFDAISTGLDLIPGGAEDKYTVRVALKDVAKDWAKDSGLSLGNDLANTYAPSYLGAPPIYRVGADTPPEVVNKPLATVCNNALTVLVNPVTLPRSQPLPSGAIP